MSMIYYCTPDNNDCPKREECKRFVEVDGKNHSTLYKVACTEKNNYVLYIKNDEKVEENDQC